MNIYFANQLAEDLKDYAKDVFLDNPKFTNNDFQKEFALKLMNNIFDFCSKVICYTDERNNYIMNSRLKDIVFNLPNDEFKDQMVTLELINQDVTFEKSNEEKLNSFEREIAFLKTNSESLNDSELIKLLSKLSIEISKENDYAKDPLNKVRIWEMYRSYYGK